MSNTDRKYRVYLITNLVNGKQYVGQTCYSMERRWIEHTSRARKGVARSLYFAIRKYGENSFALSVLRENLTRNEASKEEQLAIRSLCLDDRNFGYNMTRGGEGGVPIAEVINKICVSRGMKKDAYCGNKYFQIDLPSETISLEYKNGVSSVDLARKYGCSASTIISRLKASGTPLRNPSERTKIYGQRVGYGFENNLPNNLGKKRTPKTKQLMVQNNAQRRRDVSDEEIVRLYQEGWSSPRIASKFGMTHPAIQRRLRLNGIQLRPVGVHGRG